MKKRNFVLIIILTLFVITLYGQESENNRNISYTKGHAFSGTVLLGFEGGATFALTDYDRIKPNIIGKAMVGYYFPTTSNGVFGIRGFVSKGSIGGRYNSKGRAETFKTPITNIGGGVIYSLSMNDAVFPYIFIGGSYTITDPQDETGAKLPGNAAGIYDPNGIAYHTELGLRFLLSDAISLTVDLGAQLSNQDFYDDLDQGNLNDLVFTSMVGISYSFLTSSDSDEDGVLDEYDQCPNTPLNVKVDEFGCPIDSDNDGVGDYKDECPNTPRDVEVDEKGCALDSDMDGVPNYIDKCPNTEAGLQVDKNGCPDTDMDGVADNLDKCPNTPKGAEVDDEGCPLDSDNDGVPNYLDECENTPAGKQVDENGCATEVKTIIKEEVKKITLSGDTNFEFDKANLLPNAYRKLQPVVETMKKYKESRWIIEGHTDAIGSDSYNKKLSQERADAVVDYFIEKGIDRSRFEIVALGESQPIATNDTQEGRAMNRRVEIKLIENSIEK